MVQELAEIRAELGRLKEQQINYRGATVVATDPVAGTFDADVAGAGLLAGIPVEQPQFLPSVGDQVVLSVAGATPVYNRPSRSLPLVTDPVTGDTLAAIGEDGQVSGQIGNFETLTVGGQPFVPTTAEDQNTPRGLVEYGASYIATAATTAERGWFEVAADLEVGRMYLIQTTHLLLQSSVAGTVGRARIRMTEDGSTPSVSSPAIATGSKTIDSGDEGMTLSRLHTPIVNGKHRFLLTYGRWSGTGNVTIFGRHQDTGDAFPIQMWVTDVGPYRGNNSVPNDGGGTTTAPRQTLTKRYPATWSGTYNGSTLDTSYGNEMKQGVYKGNWRGLVGFDSTQMMADLAGATIESCYAYLYANKWWRDSGGTAVVGTHNLTARPTTFSATTGRWTSPGWPKPGSRRLNLGAAVGAEFQSGATRGLSLGPAPSNSLAYYGRFDGAGMARAPYIEIRYTL